MFAQTTGGQAVKARRRGRGRKQDKLEKETTDVEENPLLTLFLHCHLLSKVNMVPTAEENYLKGPSQFSQNDKEGWNNKLIIDELVSKGFHNKLPSTGWLETTEMIL